jgi:hypothetical protein
LLAAALAPGPGAHEIDRCYGGFLQEKIFSVFRAHVHKRLRRIYLRKETIFSDEQWIRKYDGQYCDL